MTAQTSAPRPTDAGRHVLLVEDEPDIAELVVQLLAEDGLAVRVASTLDQALVTMRETRFDLVLVDGLSGDPEQAYATALTVLRVAGDTPVALFTAHRREPDDVRAAGFADLIGKPFEIDVLTQRVPALLSG